MSDTDEINELKKEFEFFRNRGISQFSSKIVKRIIADPSPCVLVAPTGYGKSVGIPYAIVRAGYRIIIAQPTNTLCVSLYNNFKDKFPMIKLGRAYEREADIPSDAQLIVVSNGYLKNRLLGFVKGGTCKPIDSNVADVLFVDEVHMVKIDMAIIVSLWFYCTSNYTSIKFPRLVLSSATPDDTIFGRKMGYCVKIPPNMFKTVYSIDEHWQKDYPIGSKDRYKDMGMLLRAIHESTPISERVMVFVPGKLEMDQVAIASGIEADEVNFFRVMSSTTPEELEILRVKVDPKRLIVLSTPSGDAGINIDGLVHVLDSMLIKNTVEMNNGCTELVTEFISVALSKQRKGRVGRVKPGHYYPFCSQEGYSKLIPNYIPEIYRLPLYRLIIELNSHGLKIDDILGVYRIPKLQKYVDELLSWGLIRRTKLSGELFPSSGGLFISKLEIESPHLASVLYAWSKFELPMNKGIIIVNLIATMSRDVFRLPSFDNPNISKKESDRQRSDFIKLYYKRFTGRTEVHTVINIWNYMVKEIGMEEISLPDIETWCKANQLSYKVVKGFMKSLDSSMREFANSPDSSSSLNVTLSEKDLIPLRVFFEYIYKDSVARRDGETSNYVLPITGEVLSANSFSLMNKYEDKTELPDRLVVIAKQQKREKIVIEQSIDLTNDPTDITFDKIRDRLGVFGKD